MNYKAGVCNFCGTGCGHLIEIDDGKVCGVFPSQNHPVSRGRLCVRGWHIHELLRSDQRIDSPLIRKNNTLEKADYDEAVDAFLDYVSKNIKNPADEIAVLGSPRSSNEDNYLLMKLARAGIKTGNISLDSESGHRNSLNVLSTGTGMPGMLGSLEDISKTDFILVVGTDITKQNPIIGSEIHLAKERGAKVVTICSRVSQISKLSSTHIQIRPGTKKILIAALAKSLIEGDMQDSEFIEKYSEGFEGFANSLGSLNNAEIVEKTGIEIDVIRDTAKALSAAKSAMVFFASGISGLDQDTISYIYNLFLVAGKIGKEGCGVNPVAGICNLQGGYDMGVCPDLLTGFQPLDDETVLKKFSSAWGVELSKDGGKPVYDLLADKNSSIRALVVVDHDEGIVRYSERIKELDFVLYIGAFENSFTEYADVVLPVSAYIETDGTFTNTERRIQISRKKLDPPEGVLPAWQLYTRIAEKLSLNWEYASPSDIMDEIASLTPSYSGVSYDRFKGINGIQWPCDSEHPEGCARFDIDEAEGGVRFVAVTGDFTVPDVNETYPWLLMTGKSQHFWHQNNLMKRTFIPNREYNATLLLYPEGYVEINSDDAKKLGVRDKWPLKVTSEYGAMNVVANVSDDIQPGTAYVPYFIRDMISEFLLEHHEIIEKGEDAIIPVRIEKV